MVPVIKEKEETSLEITGTPKQDLKAFLKSKDAGFGVQLLEHYVPRNTRLIDYCRQTKNLKYITENLNIILNGRN